MSYRVKNLPPKVLVGNSTYDMNLVDVSVMNEIGIYGDHNSYERRIRIAEDQPEAQHAIEVVIHELIHACYDAYHIEAERDEEYTTTRLATALSGILSDNPDLLKWIAKTAK